MPSTTFSKRSLPTWLLLVIPFVLVIAVVMLATYFHNGDLQNLRHVPNFSVVVFVALLAAFGTLQVFGDTTQKKAAWPVLITLGALAMVAYLVFAVWIMSAGIQF